MDAATAEKSPRMIAGGPTVATIGRSLLALI
jgi:hypothetical protein